MLIAAAGEASVDVELAVLEALHPHRVVIEAVGAQVSGAGGPRSVNGLASVSTRCAGAERDQPVGRAGGVPGVDVEVGAVLTTLPSAALPPGGLLLDRPGVLFSACGESVLIGVDDGVHAVGEVEFGQDAGDV